MEHGKHKMPDGHMMSDEEMKKVMSGKKMKKGGKKVQTSDGYMVKKK